MTRKSVFVVLLLVCSIVLGIVGVAMFFILNSPNTNDVDSDIHWLPEESYFVDYEVVDGKVRFRYAICFVNNSEYDVGIKLSARFKADELGGWIKYSSFFEGYDENGEWDYRIINHGEKVQYIYTFEGEFLGGAVNTNLSFPEELILAQSFASDS